MILSKAMTVWSRNCRVWRKLFWGSILFNFGEPLLYLVALGFGLGGFVTGMQGPGYIVFLGTGLLCSSVMNTASFEGTYSAFTRMQVQQTWEGILTTPIRVRDLILGETLWCATKSLINATGLLTVMWALGLIPHWAALWALPIVFLLGFLSGATGLVVTSFARNYDFFLYYSALVLTPLTLLSGVFFPIERLPNSLLLVVKCLPLYHAITLVRPLLGYDLGPVEMGHHLSILIIYCAIAFFFATSRAHYRLIN